jgi:leucyl aminopeptidase
MLFPLLVPRPLDLTSVLDSDAIAIGFRKNESGEFTFPVATSLVRKIEGYFDLELTDELNFFSATGKSGEIYELPVSAPNIRCSRIILVGLGSQALTDVRAVGAALGRNVRGKALSLFSIAATSRAELRAHAIALILGSYQWNQKSEIKKPMTPEFLVADTYLDEVARANTVARAVWRARDMIHTPSNIKTPEWLAQQARSLTKNKDFSVTVLEGKDLLPFGGLRAVGNSSPNPGPRFIEVSYAPRGSKNWPHVVLVGKGITFDTGGISLKRPYDLMIGMKSDMSGAAAVLSVVSAMPDVKPKVRVTALLMCAENALSRSAQRPSDVITQYGGTTVEIINTDAEGRLVLADGLAYADLNLDPDYLIDVATLTGAATLGLGRQYAAMYTRNTSLARKLSDIGEKSGDRVWRMPLVDDYQIALNSTIADFNHTANKPKFSAGSVTAALFLEHFAGKRNWVHLDIAGPARSESDSGENPKGGTGFGVRLLIDWIAGL